MAADTPAVIGSFTGKHRFLSNFYDAWFHVPPLSPLQERICPYGAQWRTAEHAFQAAKCVTVADHARIREARTPAAVKRIGRSVQLRPGWDDIRCQTMFRILRCKFTPGAPLAEQLLATGDAYLVENNTWGDIFWGVSGGRGANWLGNLLMRVRADLGNNVTNPQNSHDGYGGS